jgi:hypothetical protein
MTGRHDAGSTQEIVTFIEAGTTRALNSMQDAEIRLSKRLDNPAVKCEIQDPLLDVFRAQRNADAQIMDNQVITFTHIVGRLDNLHNGDGNSNSNCSATPGREEGDEREVKAGKWFFAKGYRMMDIISLLAIAALIIICLSREYANYQKLKSMEQHRSSKTDAPTNAMLGNSR